MEEREKEKQQKEEEKTKLEHITLHANGEPLLERSSSHSHSSPVLK